MPAANTIKQLAMREAILKHPRKPVESNRQWFIRLATITGCSCNAFYQYFEVLRCEAIGAALRAKEAEARLKPVHIPPDALGPVKFDGWIDAFGRLKMVVEAYLSLARERGDVFAVSYLTGLREMAERAQARAASLPGY